MKQLLGNSCAKGCLVYIFALIMIVVLTTVGLGGLSAKFGAGAQATKPEVSILTTSRQPVSSAPANQAGSSENKVAQPGTSGASGTAPQQAQQQQAAQQQPTPVPVSPSPVAPQAAPPVSVKVQDGTISAEVSAPFYIVQPGDTLWDIAHQFNVGLDALRNVNKVADNYIQAGQLLYLPQAQQPGAPQQSQTDAQPQAPAPEQPAPQAPAPGQNTGTDVPTMPQTGINANP